MKMRFASAVIVAVMLSCLGSFAASACRSPIDLAAIERRIADPNLQGDLKERASALKARAAAAIEAGHREEGRGMYYQLMGLLGIASSSGRYRCN
jgi:hypothetical protein